MSDNMTTQLQFEIDEIEIFIHNVDRNISERIEKQIRQYINECLYHELKLTKQYINDSVDDDLISEAINDKIDETFGHLHVSLLTELNEDIFDQVSYILQSDVIYSLKKLCDEYINKHSTSEINIDELISQLHIILDQCSLVSNSTIIDTIKVACEQSIAICHTKENNDECE